MIFENNIITKKLKKNELKCKCGSIRYNIEVYKDDNNEYRWIMVSCKKCNKILFYNGA